MPAPDLLEIDTAAIVREALEAIERGDLAGAREAARALQAYVETEAQLGRPAVTDLAAERAGGDGR